MVDSLATIYVRIT